MTARTLALRIVVLAAALAVATAVVTVAFRSQLGHVPIVGQFLAPAAATSWVCPMHPEVTSNSPGTCPKCGMDLVQVSGAGASDPGTTDVGHDHATADETAASWVCPMHPEVTSERPGTCPKCGMDLVRQDAPGVAPAGAVESPGAPPVGREDRAAEGAPDRAAPEPRAAVTLDLRRQQLIGVRTATVVRKPVRQTTRAVGLVRYDETRLADINLKVEAFVRDLYVDYTGQYIKRGQPLFTVYSPDLLATQNEYLLALKTRDQMQTSQVADAKDYANRLASAARQRLTLWDLSDGEIDVLERTREPQTTMVFRSPVSGYVIDKRVVQGQRVMPGESLYKVADLSVVWVEADVYEREIAWVKAGERADVTIDAWPGERFSGRVTYIYPYMDESTRTVRVRLEFANPRGRLKPGMYANVELSSSLGNGLIVPADAVVDSGREQVVFLALGDGHFEPRRITAGHRIGSDIHVLDGLAEGDVVASAATFFIDSESQMRAAMQGFEAPGPLEGGARAPVSTVTIELATEPDPPRNGDNTFIVTVRGSDGAPIDAAEVSVRLYMPPMPSMNMPAMSAETRLLPQGGGVYRGRGNVSMAGRWETTVVVSRRGERLGSRQFALVAR